MIDKSHPLYACLRPLGWWLSYSDWREVGEGKYEPLASRLQRQAERLRWLSLSGNVALFLIAAHRIVRYFTARGIDDLVLAAVFGVSLAWSLRSALRRQRAFAQAVSSLRAAGASRPATGAACT